jgi:hypothetical protein
MCIPSLVETMSGLAFSNCGIREIRVAEGNRHFRVLADCLLSFDGRSLVRYFGRDRSIRIDRDIEVICRTAFDFLPASRVSNSGVTLNSGGLNTSHFPDAADFSQFVSQLSFTPLMFQRLAALAFGTFAVPTAIGIFGHHVGLY